MALLRSKSGSVFALGYIALYVLAAAFAEYSIITDPLHSEFSGIFEIVLTLPWSLMSLPILDATGYVNWYGKFTSNGLLYSILASLGLLPGAIINASACYFIGRLFDGPAAQKISQPSVIQSAKNTSGLWKKIHLCFGILLVLCLVSFALMRLPADQLIAYIGLISAVSILSRIGVTIALSYFAYALTLKNSYVLLGVLGWCPVSPAIGLAIGYVVLRNLKTAA